MGGEDSMRVTDQGTDELGITRSLIQMTPKDQVMIELLSEDEEVIDVELELENSTGDSSLEITVVNGSVAIFT